VLSAPHPPHHYAAHPSEVTW